MAWIKRSAGGAALAAANGTSAAQGHALRQATVTARRRWSVGLEVAF